MVHERSNFQIEALEWIEICYYPRRAILEREKKEGEKYREELQQIWINGSGFQVYIHP